MATLYSNAFNHSHSLSPDVGLTIKCAINEHELPPLKVIVSNVVNPDRPCVTQDYVTKALSREPCSSLPPLPCPTAPKLLKPIT